MRANRSLKARTSSSLRALLLVSLVVSGGCARHETGAHVETNQGASGGVRIHSDPGLQSPTAATATTSSPPLTKHRLQNAQLTLHVGKTGKLARLGHNHLITGELKGSAWLDDKGALHANATAQVAKLVVDGPERRAAELAVGNTNYGSVPTAKNTKDTRANMLGEKVLNAARYPELSATVIAPAASAEFANANAGSLNAQFTFTLRGVESVQSATLNWQRLDNGARDIGWSTSFAVSHQTLGITPFSALGGALRVADELQVELQGRLPGPFSLGSE